MCISGKRIMGGCIAKHHGNRTSSAGNVPRATCYALGKYRRGGSGATSRFFQTEIVALYYGKERIGAFFTAKKQTVKLHPFCAPERRSFHIIGTLDDGNTRFVESPISTTVLKGRKQQHIGFSLDNFLHVGRHSVAAIGHTSIGNPRFNLRQQHILQVAYAANGIQLTEHLQECSVSGSEEHSPTRGAADNCSFRKLV